MIPYFQYNSILLGPIPIQVWGLFVSLGLLSAVILSYKLARKYLLSGEVMIDVAVWSLIGGLLGARLFHVVFYEPVYYVSHPIDVLKFWQGGASSLGGFVGAILAVYIFSRIRKFTLKEFLPYLDISALSLWLGWGIGRLGCFMIHDHTGVSTNFFLGVNFASGVRHDLGLYESLLGFVLFIAYLLLFKKLVKVHWGLVAIFSFMDYAIVRFLLDFLRADETSPGGDLRYFFLTPAQWGMIVLFLGLTAIFIYGVINRKKKDI
jgi:phosphatidylglycerol---prolipoprotein diacylglyceryl transferase